LRVFSPVSQRRSIYWLDNTTGGVDPATGVLQPPVVGGFREGVGLFEGQEIFEGRPVRVRFEWSQMHTGEPRWQQALSADGGASSDVNWVMQFARPVCAQGEVRRKAPIDEQAGRSSLRRAVQAH